MRDYAALFFTASCCLLLAMSAGSDFARAEEQMNSGSTIAPSAPAMPPELKADAAPPPAAQTSKISDTPRRQTHSPSLFGPLGLNIAPSARMEKSGTIRASVSHLTPYNNEVIGFQIASPLYIGLRQTGEVASLHAKATRLYPGVDLKLRLMQESRFMPEMALGLQSLVGHKRTAGEYLALSKRYNNFDFTAGIGWGRFGSAGHIKNPLAIFGSHFNKKRALDGNDPNDASDWFTGKNIGFFGGVEYFTPLDGLSIKADFGADRFSAESAAIRDYKAPAPWGIGLSYSPADWVNGQVALIGGDKVMGSFTLRGPLSHFPSAGNAPFFKADPPPPFRSFRTGLALPQQMEISAQSDGIMLFDVRRDLYTVWGKLNVTDDKTPLPQQVGRAFREMANHAGPATEKLMITPILYGLKGRTISIMRRDLEQALARHQGSAEEIWRHTEFGTAPPADTAEDIELDLYHGGAPYAVPFHGWLTWDNQLSLSEVDTGLLYRTSLLAEARQQLGRHLMFGGGLRLNVADNLEELERYRTVPTVTTRGNVGQFAKRRLGLEHLYLSYLASPKQDLYTALSAGYLDEMYAAAGGEMLYRPFGKTYAFGAQAFAVMKRDPSAPFNNGLFIDQRGWTARLNGWYEFPETGLTLHASIGRYLAGDTGGTLSLRKRFENGVELSGEITATDQSDYNVFGSRTQLYSGLNLRVPLGQFAYVPNGSAIRTKIAPLGRVTGQQLDNPVALYNLTEPLSYRHVARYWPRVLD